MRRTNIWAQVLSGNAACGDGPDEVSVGSPAEPLSALILNISGAVLPLKSSAASICRGVFVVLLIQNQPVNIHLL